MNGAALLGLVTPAHLATTAVVLIAAVLAPWLVRVVLAWVIRRVATKRLAGETTRWRWRTRIVRPSETDESLAELRRHHRIDALALALSRVATVIIWSVAVLALLHIYGISVGVAVGSAGFLGLVLALGAQTSVNDYVTGLHVLLEDRFGEGDEIEVVTASGRHLRGVVTGNGMFGTRLSADGVNHHVANRFMSEVTNHSQLGVITTLDVDHLVDAATLAAATAQASAARPEMPAVVVASVEAVHDGSGTGQTGSRIHLRSSRALGDTDQHHFGQHLRGLIETQTQPGGAPRPGERLESADGSRWDSALSRIVSDPDRPVR